ncbi:unnamed protein product [Closterium sp. NIES-53]
MASLCILAFDHEGRSIQFDTWLDDLQLYLLSDSRDIVSLFDHTSGTSPSPPVTADSVTRSQWLTRDAAACLAIRNHLPLAKCAHFGQHWTAQALYDAVVAPYSLLAIAAQGRLLLPYLFSELFAFATVEDLVTHLRTSNARYRAAVPAEILHKNQRSMFITLYFIVTRLSDSLRSVRDHFLALDPTVLTINLLKQHLLAVETSVVGVGAARGTPRTPFFEGCSPSPLASSYASAAAVGVLGAEDVGAASASGKSRSSKGKVEVVAVVGMVAGVEALVEAVVAAVGVVVVAVVGVVAVGLELLSVERGASGGSGSCPYVTRTGDCAGQTCEKPQTQHYCFSHLDDAWRAEFGDEAELPCWAELLRSGVAIFDLDYDAILAGMYTLSVSAQGGCYLCVPPDPGIDAAALGSSESALPGIARAVALHTFTVDSGASCYFFRDSTTLTPLSAPIPVRLADPSGGPVLALFSTVLPCLAIPSGSLSGLHLPSFSTNLVCTAALLDAMVTTTTPGGQRVSICTCTQTGRHLATFTRRPGSSLYTLASEPPQVVASAQVSASGPVAPPCSCRLLSHQTLLWHHCLGHHSLPHLCGMHSCLLISGPPRSLPPLPPPPALPCLPCGRERYFLLVVDDYTHYTMVFPLRSKEEVPDVLIPSISAVRLQLRERFRQDLPVLRLHSDRGGEFSSDLLLNFCRGEGILQLFTLPASPQKIGIAERRIGLVMELNLWPRVSLPETSPTLRWTGAVGDASVFRVSGSRAFVRDTSGDKICARAIPCVFLGFPPNVPGWQFYHPTSRCVFPLRTSPLTSRFPFTVSSPNTLPLPHLRHSSPDTLPLPHLRHSSGPPPVDPLPPKGPAPSGVSEVDPLPGTVLVEVAVSSGAARGASSRGVASGGAEPGGAKSEGTGSGGAEPGGAESGGAEHRGTASSGGPASALPRLSPRPEPLSPKQLREWFAQRTRLQSGGAGAGDSAAGDTIAGGPGVTAGAGDTGGAAGAGPGCARTRGTGAAGTGSVGGAGAGGTGAGGAGAGGAGAGDTGAVGAGAGGTGAGGVGAEGVGAVDPGAGGAGAGGAVSGGIGVGGTMRRDHFAAELVDFAAACCLDYVIAFVAQSESASPPSVEGECALGTDVLEDKQEDFECLAVVLPHFASMLLAPEGDPDAPDIPTPRSYAEAITGPYSSQW